MICLGIESTAHTFGIGIADSDGKILANVKDIYLPKAGWGLVPHEAKTHHLQAKDQLLEKAVQEASLDLKDVTLISFSQGPGLPPCLKVGMEFAKSLSEQLSVPLIPVNHCIAHIEVGKLFSPVTDPVTLYVSGANTQVISFAEGRYRVFGETQDIGIGNALDKLAREMGLQFPGGPKIEEFAKTGHWSPLPYTVKGMDLSFSGITTAAIRKFHQKERPEDIAFSFQETCFAMLTEVTERALAHLNKEEVLLTGGVAANQRLQQMLTIMAEERGAKAHTVPRPYAMDNGAMIAWAGIVASKHFTGQQEPLDIMPLQRTDEVEWETVTPYRKTAGSRAVISPDISRARIASSERDPVASAGPRKASLRPPGG